MTSRNQKNCIYKLTSPSGKVYIGQAQDFKKRMNLYRHGRSDKQRKLHAAIKKYGWENFTKEVIDGYHGADKEGLNALETYWITHFDSVKKGYNICAIGGTCRGVKHGPEFGEKVRKRQLGKPHTSEHNKRIGEGQTGVRRSAAFGAAVTARLTGTVRTKESREKQRRATKGVPKAKKHAEAIGDALRGKPKSAAHVQAIKDAWVERKKKYPQGNSREAIEKTRQANIGAKRSPEACANMKAAWELRRKKQGR